MALNDQYEKAYMNNPVYVDPYDEGQQAAREGVVTAYAPTYRRLLYVTNSIGLAVGDQMADSIRQGLQ